MTPQFCERPLIPNVCATIDGKTPKRNPYATPVMLDTMTRSYGFEMIEPASCVNVNMRAETKRHQKRDRRKFFTSTSDPMPARQSAQMSNGTGRGPDAPLNKRPTQLVKDRIDTCMTCRCWMNLEVALSS